MPKLTPEQLEQTVRDLITQYVDLASKLSSVKVELNALREVLSTNAPDAVAGYDERREALMNQFLDHLDTVVAKGQDAAVELRMRRLLEEYDGPKQ